MTASDRPAPIGGEADGTGPLTADDVALIARHAARADRRHPWNTVGHHLAPGTFVDIYADRTGVTALIRDAHGTRTGHLPWRALDRAAGKTEPVQGALLLEVET